MIKAFSAFLLTTIISFVVMVGALLIWVTIQGTHITNPSDGDGLGFAVAYGGIAAIPILTFGKKQPNRWLLYYSSYV